MVLAWESFSPAYRAGITEQGKYRPTRTYGELTAHDLLFTEYGIAATVGLFTIATGLVGLVFSKVVFLIRFLKEKSLVTLQIHSILQ